MCYPRPRRLHNEFACFLMVLPSMPLAVCPCDVRSYGPQTQEEKQTSLTHANIHGKNLREIMLFNFHLLYDDVE